MDHHLATVPAAAYYWRQHGFGGFMGNLQNIATVGGGLIALFLWLRNQRDVPPARLAGAARAATADNGGPGGRARMVIRST